MAEENGDGGLYDHDIDDSDIDGSDPKKTADQETKSGAAVGGDIAHLYSM